jgi:exopolyphosphatase/guanosine-5'-triphosphate,3'-diphosphate pyrophosphatase
MRRGRVTRIRAIATEACRTARNGPAFVERVKAETGIEFDVISPAEEAVLAARGCAPLVDPEADSVLVFDIGGGSTELIRLDLKAQREAGMPAIRCWASVPCGVVTLTEAFGPADDETVFRRMVDEVRTLIQRALEQNAFCADYASHNVHMLGTSGTVTTLAGVHLGLKRYERNAIDGVWLDLEDIRGISSRLAGMSCGERAQVPCIGPDRADLVVAGCAILEAIHEIWPCERLRVADRGLREGVLLELMEAADAEDRRRRRPRRRPQKPKTDAAPRSA